MLWLPGGLALFLDIGMILRKVRGLFAKQPLFAQSRPSTLRSDGRDRGATWPLSLTVILARIRNKILLDQARAMWNVVVLFSWVVLHVPISINGLAIKSSHNT
jgi:hypothetical protein